MARFRYAFYKLLPSWLTRGEGERLWYVLGYVKDAMAERGQQSLFARFPQYAVDKDALRYLGKDRAMTRGLNESDDSYARRLVNFRGAHKTRGNAVTLARQVASYLPVAQPDASVDVSVLAPLAKKVTQTYTAAVSNGAAFPAPVHSAPEYPVTVPAEEWSRFSLEIDGYPGWSAPQKIGDPALWGNGKVGGDGEPVIGVTGLNASDMSGLRALVRFWKRAGSQADYLTTLGIRIRL
jgi:hypothetical protein